MGTVCSVSWLGAKPRLGSWAKRSPLGAIAPAAINRGAPHRRRSRAPSSRPAHSLSSQKRVPLHAVGVPTLRGSLPGGFRPRQHRCCLVTCSRHGRANRASLPGFGLIGNDSVRSVGSGSRSTDHTRPKLSPRCAPVRAHGTLLDRLEIHGHRILGSVSDVQHGCRRTPFDSSACHLVHT